MLYFHKIGWFSWFICKIMITLDESYPTFCVSAPNKQFAKILLLLSVINDFPRYTANSNLNTRPV